MKWFISNYGFLVLTQRKRKSMPLLGADYGLLKIEAYKYLSDINIMEYITSEMSEKPPCLIFLVSENMVVN